MSEVQPNVAAVKSEKSIMRIAKTDNPFREGGSYYSVVEALRKLGKGKFHSAADLIKAFPKAMGAENFKAFKVVKPRNKKTGKDCDGRIIQNALVLVRPDYGRPLREAGSEVRYERNKDDYRFGLFGFSGKLSGVKTRKSRKAVKSKVKKSK